MERKIQITLDDYERNLIIRALNDLRNSQLQERRPTDAVDELMVKVYEARKKRSLVAEEHGFEEYR